MLGFPLKRRRDSPSLPGRVARNVTVAHEASEHCAKGLRRLYGGELVEGSGRGYRGQAPQDADLPRCDEGPDELRALPTWKAHVLTGDRKDVWSLHVTRNWRMTFRIEDGEIVDLNLEDYH